MLLALQYAVAASVMTVLQTGQSRHTLTFLFVNNAASWMARLALTSSLHCCRRECAGLDRNSQPRKPADVAWSCQRYLIFAILSCIPGTS